MLPRKLHNFNVIFEGHPLAGIAEEVILPKLKRKMEAWAAAGMLGPVKADFGMDEIEIELTLGEFNPDLLRLWGHPSATGLNVRFLGACRADDGDGAVDAIEVSVRGRLEEIDHGNAKLHDQTKVKYKLPLAYFKYTRNAEVLIEIDLIAGKEVVGGVDRTAAVRQALGLTV